MGLEIRRDTPGSLKAWETLTDNSFINSPGFASIWKERGGTPIFIVDNDQGTYRAGLVLLVFGGKFYRRIESMPSGLPGGYFFAGDISPEVREEIVKKMDGTIKAYYPWRIVINGNSTNLIARGYTRALTGTHLLTVSENWETELDPGIREHLRAAARRGARVETFDNSRDLPQFFEMAKASEEAHGQKIRYTFRFFERLWELSQNDPRIIWLKAVHDDKMIGSRISFLEHGYLINWQLYLDGDSKSFKPGYLLMEHIMRQAQSLNIKYINMGGSPAEALTLQEYKEKWGGRETEVTYYIYHNLPGRLFLNRGRR